MRPPKPIDHLWIRPLAACLAATLLPDAHGEPHFAGTLDRLSGLRAMATAAAAHDITPAGSTTLEVSNCDDDGSPGTLRAVIGAAADGDTVDLSLLTCSTITLAAGQLVVNQGNLTIGASAGHPITIDGADASRIIEHEGLGTLHLANLEITRGYQKYESGTAFGGCILSVDNVYLDHSDVSSCRIVSADSAAFGGGVFAHGYVKMTGSSVTGSSATGVDAEGGGVWSYGLYAARSAVTGNSAVSTIDDPANSIAEGGGFLAKNIVATYQLAITGNQASSTYGSALGGGGLVRSSATLIQASTISGNVATSPGSNGGGLALSGTDAPHYILYSTIDHNESVNNAALSFYGTASRPNEIIDSTISSNVATTGSSAIFASNPLYLYNCTIAFNVAAGSSAGIYLYPGGDLTIESTIISNNTSTSGDGFDLVARAGVSGSHNLIQNPASTVPGDTIVGIDPGLGPLTDNGGPTLTHALGPGSAAIDFGFNPFALGLDQRLAPRVFGIAADIGAYEWQGAGTDTIFENGFDP